MPKSICVKCEIELKPEINGVIVVEMFQQNKEIYRLWEADLWKCPVCGVGVVLGFASKPFMLHFEDNCNALVEKFKQDGKRIVYDKELQYA